MRVIVLCVAISCLLSGQATASVPQTAGVYRPGNGVSLPVLVREFKPQYTPAAMRAGVQGVVVLECVVGIDGTVTDVRVTRSLDTGLDQEAIKAAKRWLFKPGTKDGQPVPVRITLELAFTLSSTPKPPLFPTTAAATPTPSPALLPAQSPVFAPGNGVSAPMVIEEVKPQYTPAAKDARIQGVVTLECVVGIDGTVGEVRVIASLDAALDEEAIKAAKRWLFKPGTKDGQPVPVRISLEMTFTLR